MASRQVGGGIAGLQTHELEFRDRASHLGEVAGQADDRLEAHLHEVFDHSIGSLGAAPLTPPGARPAQAPKVAAGQIADWLRRPEDLRRAIILQTILRSPLDDD